MWHRLPRHAILIFWLLVSAPAWADGDADGDDVGDVVVEGHARDERAPSAFAERVRIAPLIERGEQLAAGLGATVGVNVQRAGVDGSGAQVSVRGASAGQVLATFGGVPINPARGGGLDLDLIPPALLADATVYRGGSALRFGRGAIGGAVVLEPAWGEAGTWASAGFGSFGTLRGGAGWAGGDDDLRGLLAMDALRSDGEFPFEDDQGTHLRRVNADVRRLGVAGSVTWRPAPAWRLRVTDLGSAADRGRPAPAEFQGVRNSARSSEANNTAGVQVTRYGVAEGEVGVLDLELTGGHRLRWSHYRNPDRLLRSSVGYDARATEHRGYAGVVASLWGEDEALFAGVDADMDAVVTRSTASSGDVLEAAHERAGVGGFLSTVWELGPASLSGGVRVEKVEGFDAQVAPAAGIVVDAGAGFSVLGNVARAWRAPSFDELYLDEELIVGDPALRPESALSADVGFRWTGPSAQVEVVGFWLEMEEVILFLPVSATLYRAQNTGGARSVGAEATLRVVSGPLGWDTAYTLTDARLDVPPQDPLPGRPRHRIRTEVRVGNDVFEVFARVRARSDVFLDNFANLRDEAVMFVDAGAVGRPVPGWSVAVVGENLGDQRASVDRLGQPLPGLVWKVQVTARGLGQ